MNLSNENQFDQLLDYLKTFETNEVHNQKALQKIIGKEAGNRTEIKFEDVVSELPASSNYSSFNVARLRERAKERLINEHIGRQNYERPYVNVTELLTCVRQNYYYRLKYQVELEKYFNFVYLKLYGDVGSTVHKYVQDIYGFTENEKPLFSNVYKVKGKVDAIEKNIVYELKTTDSTKYKGNYEEDHYHQGNIYSYILNTEYKYNIRTITIVYFFRDSLKTDPIGFDLPINNDLAVSYLNRSNILLEAISSRRIPDKIGSTEEKCRYCMYKDYCKRDDTIVEENKVKPLKAVTSFKM